MKPRTFKIFKVTPENWSYTAGVLVKGTMKGGFCKMFDYDYKQYSIFYCVENSERLRCPRR